MMPNAVANRIVLTNLLPEDQRMIVLTFLALFLAIATPAFAGSTATPELDATTLSSIASVVTGGYIAFRMYSLKAKSK